MAARSKGTEGIVEDLGLCRGKIVEGHAQGFWSDVCVLRDHRGLSKNNCLDQSYFSTLTQARCNVQRRVLLPDRPCWNCILPVAAFASACYLIQSRADLYDPGVPASGRSRLAPNPLRWYDLQSHLAARFSRCSSGPSRQVPMIT